MIYECQITFNSLPLSKSYEYVHRCGSDSVNVSIICVECELHQISWIYMQLLIMLASTTMCWNSLENRYIVVTLSTPDIIHATCIWYLRLHGLCSDEGWRYAHCTSWDVFLKISKYVPPKIISTIYWGSYNHIVSSIKHKLLNNCIIISTVNTGDWYLQIMLSWCIIMLIYWR